MEVWTKIETRVYLKSLGINDSFIKELIKKTKASKMLNPNDPPNIETIQYPSMWRDQFTLDQFIDTPMHLLFQGIKNL